METGWINSSGEFIKIPFYEIGPYAEKVVNEYILNSEDHSQYYDSFKSEYETFSPAIDFLICKLGYKLYNPFLDGHTVLAGINDQIIDINANNSSVKLVYPKMTEKFISKASVENLESGLISPYGTLFSLDNGAILHDQLCQLLFMHVVTYSKEYYDDYIKQNPIDLMSYFRERLGYLQVVVYPDNYGFICYNPYIISGFMQNFLNSVKYFYPNVIHEPNSFSKEDSIIFEPEEEMKYASKRF